MAVKWLALRGPFTAGSWQALNGRQMATLKRAICDKKWLAMLPFLPFVALTETTNGPFMSCLLGYHTWYARGMNKHHAIKSYVNTCINYLVLQNALETLLRNSLGILPRGLLIKNVSSQPKLYCIHPMKWALIVTETCLQAKVSSMIHETSIECIIRLGDTYIVVLREIDTTP